MFYQLHQLHRCSRRSSVTSASSSDDDKPTATVVEDSPFDYSRRQSTACCSELSCEGLTAGRTRDLWRCMLELQGLYGCYHSARIDVAMEAGEEGVNYMPNRFIIDTLNNSVVDFLPEEGREMLNQYLCHDEVEPSKK